VGDLAAAVAASPLHTVALDLLRNVPGFPPIIQAVHLLAIAAVMGSVVLVDLKILGLALPGQDTGDVVRRLMPWTWWALPVLALSGLVFVFAQPHRYADNPIFKLKFTLLPAAIAVAVAVHRIDVTRHRRTAKALAALSIALWVMVVLAGRWIAYVDYLLPVE
jgi:uncharacterized membrane protein